MQNTEVGHVEEEQDKNVKKDDKKKGVKGNEQQISLTWVKTVFKDDWKCSLSPSNPAEN